MRAYERLLRYIQFDTASDETSDTCPSTEKQLVLANALVEEMRALGLEDVRMDEHGYVYGYLPETAPGRETIGLIAHMDTVNSVPVLPMNARIIENYDGGPVTLENGDILDPAVFPEVASAKGKSLMVTDGRTLLGADDKAGIAEILTACEKLLADPSLPHGRVGIAFTPDEEIGRGADLFDVKGFGAAYAYTVDGSEVGSIEYENFNAASATVTVHGRSVHPGSAKNKMVNAALVAMEFARELPPAERPEHTEGYEGFFHLIHMEGDEETAKLTYIIRDHDRDSFEKRKQLMRDIAAYLNTRYPDGTIELALKDSYYNMRGCLEDRMDIVERAEKAYRKVGVEPFASPIRGGTDGATLSYKGLLCPNLATGGMNYHGRFECVAIEDMDIMADMLVQLILG